ncbi:hypothetical protein ACQJBY_009544 [Aegilops geniculata]
MLNEGMCSEERTVAGGGAAMSGFSESERTMKKLLTAQSTGKVDPQAPGWAKRVRVSNQPSDRAPCPERVGALEQTMRGCAGKLGGHVVEPAIGLTFDSLGEAYDFYNLYSWEHGFGIRYGKSRLNADKTKCMQEVVCSYSVSFQSSLERCENTIGKHNEYPQLRAWLII